MMNIDIRSATKDDIPFLAWVMLTAGRSHLQYGVWDHYIGGTEHDCLSFLKLVASTQKPHLFHYSTFIVAEIDGQQAGGLSGYDPTILGMKAFAEALPEIFQKVGWSREEQKAAVERYLSWATCVPDDTEGVWVVESVAARPEHRRKGVVNALLAEILNRGRESGYKRAQIGCSLIIPLPGGPMRRADLLLSVKREIRVSRQSSTLLASRNCCVIYSQYQGKEGILNFSSISYRR